MADNRATLKAFFETGDVPTQAQFASLIDSLFALIDDNTVTKVIIVNVPTVGDGTGGKILKRGDAVISMGEFGDNDTNITSDNGLSAAGGEMFVANSEASFFFDGARRVSANAARSIIEHAPGSVAVEAFSVDLRWAGVRFLVGNDVEVGINIPTVGIIEIKAANVPTALTIIQINSRSIRFGNIPTFADNAAALTGGLLIEDVYKTATGELRIVV